MEKGSKVIFLLLLLSSVLLSAYFYYSYALSLPNSQNSAEVSFAIDPGESVSEIAVRLQDAGLLRSAALFQVYVILNGLSTKLQAGDYSIPQNLTVKELVAMLGHGTFEEKITLIEGWRREEYADAINSTFKMRDAKLTGAEFLKRTEGLEGYLFPDTYFVSRETTAAELVRMMRENFDQKVSGLTNNSGVNFAEAVIIASIVEREVADSQEKPIVAGILIKRYLNGWPLQADATVQYALANQRKGSAETSRGGGWWKESLTAADLQVESFYNTYLHPGLPPTPICNPGLDSLKAVFNPQQTAYWYYLSDREGKMHYAVTNEEHQRNVARYLGGS